MPDNSDSNEEASPPNHVLVWLILAAVLVLAGGGGLVWYLLSRRSTSDQAAAPKASLQGGSGPDLDDVDALELGFAAGAVIPSVVEGTAEIANAGVQLGAEAVNDIPDSCLIS